MGAPSKSQKGALERLKNKGGDRKKKDSGCDVVLV